MTTPTPPQPADRFNPHEAAARIHDLDQQITAIEATRPAELLTPYAFIDDPAQQQAWQTAHQQWTASHPTAEQDLADAHRQVHDIAAQAEAAGWDPHALWDAADELGAPGGDGPADSPAPTPAPAEPAHRHAAIDDALPDHAPDQGLDLGADLTDGFGLDD